MTVYLVNFDSGTPGATITTGTEPGLAQVGISNGAWSYDNTLSMHGANSAKLTVTNASGNRFLRVATASTYAISAQYYMDTAGALSTNPQVLGFYNAAIARMVTIRQNLNGTVDILNSSSVAVWTSTNAATLGSFIRYDAYLTVDSTNANNGTLKFAFSYGDSTTPIDSTTVTGLATTTAAVGNAMFGGALVASNYNQTMNLDTLRVNDAATDIFNPYVQTSTATLAATATLDATAATSIPSGANLSATATLSASATVTVNQTGAATLAATAGRTATAQTGTTGGTTLPVAATLNAAATRGVSAAATLGVTASRTATASNGVAGSATLAVTATLSASATVSTGQTATATLAVIATPTATAQRTAAATGALSATANLTAGATVARTATTALAVTVGLTSAATVTPVSTAVANLSVTAAFTATATVQRTAQASLAVTATRTATANVTTSQTATATLAVVVTLTAVAEAYNPSGPFVIDGYGSIVPRVWNGRVVGRVWHGTIVGRHWEGHLE